ncbi:MAG: hypothetical protein MR496_06135 [Eubacterium sp.]|nr:hypothetical protein [Eubacterium sp.]
MRKRVLIGMMVLTLGAGLVGCGKSETNKTENNTTTAAGGSQIADASTDVKKEARVDTSSWNKSSIGTKGSVKYPTDYFNTKDVGEFIYRGNNPDYTIVICPALESKGKELSASTYDEIFEDATKVLGRNYYRKGIFKNAETYKDVKIVTETKKECKINGHDAFNFTAKTTGAANNKERYVYGYLSCTPEEPFTVYGIVLTDSDSDALKKEIQTEVDAIMNTFETK